MKKLEYLLKRYSMQQLAELLGYKSRSTICTWVKNNDIPLRAQNKVDVLYKKLKG